MMMIPGMRLRALNFTGSWTSSVLARGEVIAAMNSLGLVLPLPAAGDQELHLLISEGQPLLVEMRGHLNPEGFYLWLYTPLMVGGELDEVVDELDRRIRATAGNGSRRWTSSDKVQEEDLPF